MPSGATESNSMAFWRTLAVLVSDMQQSMPDKRKEHKNEVRLRSAKKPLPLGIPAVCQDKEGRAESSPNKAF